MSNYELLDELIDKINFQNKKEAKIYYEFIEEEFIPFKSKKSYKDVKKNIESLKEMDLDDIYLVKSRLKQLEEDNDPSKYFPSLIAIFLMIQSLYLLLLNKNNTMIFEFLYFAILVISVLVLTLMFFSIVRKRNTNIYFNNVINSIHFNKESKNHE